MNEQAHHAGTPDDGTRAVDVANVVLATDGVAGLHGGMFGEVATYLPGRRQIGIKLLDPGAEIHLTLHTGAPIGATAAIVRDRVVPLVGSPVNVTVEDLVDAPTDAAPTDTAPTDTGPTNDASTSADPTEKGSTEKATAEPERGQP